MWWFPPFTCAAWKQPSRRIWMACPKNCTVHGWSYSCFWEFIITNYIPGTLKNMLFYSIDVWWNTHLSCNLLDLSNLNNHFQVDVSGSRYLYVYKVSPYQIYFVVNRVTLEPSHSIDPQTATDLCSSCWCYPKKGLLNTDKHSLDHFSLKLAILKPHVSWCLSPFFNRQIHTINA